MLAKKGANMHRVWWSLLVVGFFSLVTMRGAQAAVEVGDPAPEFCLPSSTTEGTVCLEDFKGEDNVVLLFYVLDFTPG